MISIVFSTKSPKPNFIKHIKETIGLKKWEYEVIEVINNSDNSSKWYNGGKSLTEVYAEGLVSSKYDTVVFCHDDILFDTKKWGKKILKHFEKTDYGILGVAGSTKMSKDGVWWSNKGLMLGIVNHINEGKKWTSNYSKNFDDKVLESVVVDGLFFVVNKNRLKYDFDLNVKGFHFYDIDFTFGNHKNGCKVGVMFDIRITHKSIGITNKSWLDNKTKFIEKWGDSLPTEIKGEILYDDPIVKLKSEPKVNVIIPTKGNLDLLFSCVKSITHKSYYKNLEVIIADTGSTNEEIKSIKEFIVMMSYEINIKLVMYDFYNFAKINNDVVKYHTSSDCELLLFCNNDIELINDAITNMVLVYQKNKKTVGTVGARLHYKNNKIQHAGIVSTLNKYNSLSFTHLGLGSNYNYKDFGEVIGNTAAFLLMSKSLFNSIGGFNEAYIECFEDVELNLECILKGKNNLFMGNAVCYHYESVSRGKSDEAMDRLRLDFKYRLLPFISKHKELHKYIVKIK
tara:strand:+ start:1913 stop:3445 length:1533 start_codon:yes stop_codon:yes gene_type:complete